MKKILATLLLLFVIISVFPTNMVASAATSGYYEYIIEDNKVTITYISQYASGSIAIPSTINGYPVTTLRKTAFGLCDYVTSVTIPSSISSIPTETFYDSNIAEIHVDENNVHYSSQDGVLFNKDKTRLIQYPPKKSSASYDIPFGVVAIYPSAFNNCDYLKNISFPETLTNIYESAFYGCDFITDLHFPDSLLAISELAFQSCYNLTNITFGKGIKDIRSGAFTYCENISNVNITNLAGWCEMTMGAGMSNPLYYADTLSINGVITNKIVLPDEVTKINDHVFNNCKAIHSVQTGKNCTRINSFAFNQCVNINSVVLNCGLTFIGQSAFATCVNLSGIYFPNTLQKIDTSAFNNCVSLRNIYYGGTPSERSAITVMPYNNNLNNAFWFWSKCVDFTEHQYKYLCDSQCSKCGSKRSDAVHSSTGATCTKDNTCRHCGKVLDKAFGHQWKKASCTKAKTCTICGATSGKALGHTYSNACDKTCNVCKATRKVGAHKYTNTCDTTCNICKAKRTIKHTYSNACDKSCNVCKATRKVSAHKYSNACDKTCNVCKATRKVGAHKYTNNCDTTCNICKAKRTIKHTYSNACDTTCNICKAKRTIKHTYSNACDKSCNVCKAARKVPAHKYSNACDKTCNVCKAIRKVPAHKYSNKCDATCNVCKAKRTIKHKYSNACDTACNICKAKRKAPHKYSNNCDTNCNVCKAKRTIKHTYSNACDKSCNVCKATRKVPAHKYSNACDKTCNVCKATRKVPAHKYSNKCDTTCNICKATRKITHSYKTTTTKATLAKNGSVVKKCTVCKKVASTTTIKYAKTFKLSTTSYTYDGKVKTPSVVVKDSSGKTLKKNTDYTVTYASGRKNAGTYKVTIKFKGKYSGTKNLYFDIIKATDGQEFKKYCKYTISNKQVAIEKVEFWESDSFIIPSNVNGYPVTKIKSGAFYNTQATSITIPASVADIEIDYEFAFGGPNVKNIYVDSTNKYYSSVDGVLLNKKKTEILCYPSGRGQTNYTIPNTVKTIKSGAFHLSEIKSLTIPNSVTHIESGGISWCHNLQSVTIGNGLKSIDNTGGVFEGCGSLKQITVSNNNKYFTSVNGVLFNKDKTELIRYSAGKTGNTYTVPSTVTTICSNAFDRCENLTTVVLGNNVSLIDWNAFYCCYNLKSITLGMGIKTIEDAFDFCESLTDVYYKGSKAQKEEIDFGCVLQEELTSAKWHYNS